MNKIDWRTNLSEVSSLADLDPSEVMVYFRHQYLDAAKDLMDEDPTFAEGLTDMAMLMQEAIERQLTMEHVINLSPAFVPQ